MVEAIRRTRARWTDSWWQVAGWEMMRAVNGFDGWLDARRIELLDGTVHWRIDGEPQIVVTCLDSISTFPLCLPLLTFASIFPNKQHWNRHVDSGWMLLMVLRKPEDWCCPKTELKYPQWNQDKVGNSQIVSKCIKLHQVTIFCTGCAWMIKQPR